MMRMFLELFSELEIVKSVLLEVIIIVLASTIGMLKDRQLLVAKIADRKNKKIIDNVILSKVKDESIKEFLKKAYKYWFDMFLIFVAPFIILLVCGCSLAFLNVRFEVFSEHQSAYILLGVLFGGLFLVWLVAKIHFQNGNKLKWFVFIWVESLYCLLLLSFEIERENMFYLLVSCVWLVWVMLLILFVNIVGFRRRYKNKYICISEGFRYTVLLFVSIVIMKNIVAFTYISYFWMLLVSIEYLVVIWNDDRRVVDVVIHLKETNKVVREAIVECHDKRIMYINGDKQHEFVEVEEIDYISYEIHEGWRKSKKTSNHVRCILKDGTELSYQYYYCINKEWLSFSNSYDNYREVHIYHIGKIDGFGEGVN